MKVLSIFCIVFSFSLASQAASLKNLKLFDCDVQYNRAIPGSNDAGYMTQVLATSANSAVEILANKYILTAFGLVHPKYSAIDFPVEVKAIECN